MKFTPLVVLATVLPLGNAFLAATPTRVVTTDLSATQKKKRKGKKSNFMGDFLINITNNFEPIHGHGSLEHDLDEQWQAQQAILQDRRKNQLDKTHLKEKYKNPNSVKFDLKVGTSKKTTSHFDDDSTTAPSNKPWGGFTP